MRIPKQRQDSITAKTTASVTITLCTAIKNGK